MFHVPEYSHCVSTRLSEVMNDIGVNEQTVLKRRRDCLVKESMLNTSHRLQDISFINYIFGSRSEGSTTLGLNSDLDRLTTFCGHNIIQDWNEWRPDVINYLMIQDETVTPGYCLLQRLREDAPLPYSEEPHQYHVRDRTGRILIKNTIIHEVFLSENQFKNGPSHRIQEEGCIECDSVRAYHCKSWPVRARNWVRQQSVCGWPSDQMKLFSINSGCFIVPVGGKESDNEECQWRISTSLAERCLMFSFNITQLRCYILMKMILKTHIDPYFEETLSSFMCKTVLFYCIQNTDSNIWRESTLLPCLTSCLVCLYNFILCRNCPHFILPENNLMKGKISDVVKPQLLNIMRGLIQSNGHFLFGIDIDDLGERLQRKFNVIYDISQYLPSSLEVGRLISGIFTMQTAHDISDFSLVLLSYLTSHSIHAAKQRLSKYILDLSVIYKDRNIFEQTGCNLIAPFLFTTLGSVQASNDIQTSNNISPQALAWFCLGLKSDVSSSRLKLASGFYCSGDFERAEFILTDTEQHYNIFVVEQVCTCYTQTPKDFKLGFLLQSNSYAKTEEAVKYITSFCLRFLPLEINCVPLELQYEMYRSTEEDRPYWSGHDFMMDWAVVDSLPYLYFLQYKTNGHLGRYREQENALANLIMCIDNEDNLRHTETALNLLGQCFEQENRPAHAIQCYMLSLKLRGRNNAAKFHICRVLANTLNNS